MGVYINYAGKHVGLDSEYTIEDVTSILTNALNENWWRSRSQLDRPVPLAEGGGSFFPFVSFRLQTGADFYINVHDQLEIAIYDSDPPRGDLRAQINSLADSVMYNPPVEYSKAFED